MTNLTDTKPVACGGPVLRRTDGHILDRSIYPVTASGDAYLAPPMRNFALTTTPDSDPAWGEHPCPEEE
jgi:hypothetical protein